MKFTVTENTRIERYIAPPMPISITLPFRVEDPSGYPEFVIYLSCSAFNKPIPTGAELKYVAQEIMKRLE